MSTTNLPHNRWAALLEDNLDATQVHRLIAESVAEREAALLQDPGSASAHSTPATSSQQLRSAPRRATHPRDAVALPSSVSQSACSSRASSPVPERREAAAAADEFSLLEKLAEAQAEAQAKTAEVEAARRAKLILYPMRGDANEEECERLCPELMKKGLVSNVRLNV